MPDIPDLTTVEQWQRFLDRAFPEGIVATQILYSEESALSDESPQVIMSGVRVLELEEDGSAVLSLKWQGIERDSVVTVERLEPRDFGYLAVTSETDAPDYLLSRNLSDTQREAVKREREGET